MAKLKIAGVAQKNTQTGQIDKAYALVDLNKKEMKPQPSFLPRVAGKMYVTIYVGANHQSIKEGDEIEVLPTITGSWETERGAAVNVLNERAQSRNSDTTGKIATLALGALASNTESLSKLTPELQAAFLQGIMNVSKDVVLGGKADSATRLTEQRSAVNYGAGLASTPETKVNSPKKN